MSPNFYVNFQVEGMVVRKLGGFLKYLESPHLMRHLYLYILAQTEKSIAKEPKIQLTRVNLRNLMQAPSME